MPQIRKIGFERMVDPQPIERTAKTDQTGRMPRLIRVFAGLTVILLVLSWGGSHVRKQMLIFTNIVLSLASTFWPA